jgi:hypothetical protein
MTLQTEDRVLMERLNRLELKTHEIETAIQETKRELELVKTTEIIRRWRRRSKHA